MTIYLFIILLAILCLYLTNDTWKYLKIRKTDIKGSRIELYYIFCLTSIILSSISKLILLGYTMVNGIALILFIISIITGAIAFLYFNNFLFFCSVVYNRQFSFNILNE